MNESKESILVVDDDPSLQRVLKAALVDEGYRVEIAADGEQGRTGLEQLQPDLVLLDLNLPDGNGLDFLQNWKQELQLRAPVIVITAQNTVDNAITAMQAGAFDYLVKPFDLQQLYSVVDEALSSVKVITADADAKQKTETSTSETRLVGGSPSMRNVYKTIGRMARSDATALILGESGTGKELVARAIHEFSERCNRPFVAVNTAAIPGDLLEAELFGYEKGAFTGALQASPGKFREAAGGTLLLDEIGDMPLPLQGKLLRVLQEREITPLGGRKTVPIDVRIIAATQIPLEEAVEDGRFRGDLYYRLNVVRLDIPPLRERPEDIAPLCEHFLQLMVQAGEIPPKQVSADAISMLEALSWPGNVRQLQNLLRRVALLSPARELDIDVFQRYGGEFAQSETPTKSFADIVSDKLRHYVFSMQEAGDEEIWGEVIGTVEQVLLRLALEASSGNQLKAAQLLGINRNTIRKKITEYEIEPKAFKRNRKAQ